MKYLIGIDEVGRGPLAGPVTVGIVALPKKDSKKVFSRLNKLGLNDSKKVSEVKREGIVKEGLLEILHTTSSVHPKHIDKHGLTKSISVCIKKGLKKLNLNPKDCDVRLDGLLKAPDEYIYQETIIKGDTKEPSIMLASVIAKVKRDRYMIKASRKYPEYGFDVHKGYGTKRHREAILKHGVCDLHRRGYCRGVNSLYS